MTRKRFRQACGIIAALGFLLVLGTAGASDCDLIKPENITIKTALKLAQALDCQPEDLTKPDKEEE